MPNALWQGPESSSPQGGISFSLLNRFLACRERFRVHALEGLRPRPRFQFRTEYGIAFHLCEETYAVGGDWRAAVAAHMNSLAERFPFDRDEINKWYNVCLVQFPVYLDYWRAGKEPVPVTTLFREEVFDVPYTLPSGRVCRLRGKFDGADLVGSGPGAVVYLDEKKTKGEVDEHLISRQLTWDLQTMIYLIALEPHVGAARSAKTRIQGVRYSVVRRPLSGGKGTIVQKKGSKNVPAETSAEYYARLAQYIKDEPETYFFRWTVDVAPGDIQRFKDKTLDPLLDFVCAWYDVMTGTHPYRFAMRPGCLHWQHPFGCFNPIDDGGQSDLDAYVTSGDDSGLVRATDMFPELNGG